MDMKNETPAKPGQQYNYQAAECYAGCFQPRIGHAQPGNDEKKQDAQANGHTGGEHQPDKYPFSPPLVFLAFQGNSGPANKFQYALPQMPCGQARR
jgi:hypothetical protein